MADIARTVMPAPGCAALNAISAPDRGAADRGEGRLPGGILDRMAAPAPTKPGSARQAETEAVEAAQRPWVTIVWDDPVNLMNYVTYIFQKLFGYSEPHATKLMMQVHTEGKAVVSAGTRESMEVDVSKLHAAGLWATMQQDR
jgi:ATP-dependent Clp protease adaptor protein ClpS